VKVSAVLVSRLKPLVTMQRRLEKQLVPLEALQAKEADVRKHIDDILLENGFASGDSVRVGGYDVKHNERRGRTSVNADKLRGSGVPELDIQLATETGQPAKFATVKPAKGATVRAA
jgi:hypothetical protein